MKGPRRAEQGAANMSDTKVKVAVRVRPMNRRGEPLSSAPFAFLLGPRAGGVGRQLCKLLGGGGRGHCDGPAWPREEAAPRLRQPPLCARGAVSLPARDRATRAGCGRGCSTLQRLLAPVLSELELNTKCVVEMEGNQTVLHPPPSNTKQGER